MQIIKKSPLMKFSRTLVRLKYIQFIQDGLDETSVRKYHLKILYLYQTYILHLVANWQSYIEDTLLDVKEALFEAREPGPYRESINRSFDSALRGFNTPNTQKIDDLFRHTIGLEKISDSWCWEGTSRDKTTRELKDVLDIRHKIAHEGRSGTELGREKNFDYMRNIYSIACCTNNRIIEHFKTEFGIELYWLEKDPTEQ